MDDDTSFQNDKDWLMLPLARREVALLRRKHILEFEQHEQPSETEALNAARAMGVTLSTFYRLRRAWLQQQGSIFSLVPFGVRGAKRKPQLDDDVHEEINRIVSQAIAEGDRKPVAILLKIAEHWSRSAPIPSHMTLRRHISEALSDLTGPPNNITLNNANVRQELIEEATSYGEVVAIDHVPLNVFVHQSLGPTVPLASLAIDLHSTTICGYALFTGAPGPAQVIAAMHAAQRMTAATATAQAVPVRPRVIFAATHSAPWKEFLTRVALRGIDASVRQQTALHYGGMARRLIGGSIGVIGLTGKQRLNHPVFDRTQDVLLEPEQLAKIFREGVDALNGKRLRAEMLRPPLVFDI
ncbi:hypothetical protein ACSMXM_12095 [Pacificimonas sp. ICDLI1SI03]